MSNINVADFLKEKNDLDSESKAAQALVRTAEKLGESMAKNRVTTTQIRNVYGTMKKLEMLGWSSRTARELLLMKPRLAYAATRQKNVEELREVISASIDCVVEQNNQETFKRFCQFFEAIVAYHRANGGK